MSAGLTSTARTAGQLEPAQLEDFQRAARTLLAHPLVTDTWPRPGALVAVRRWETLLRTEFGRILGYRLEVGRTCARLYRRPATLATTRGATTRTGRPLGPLGCASLCLVLAALESLGEQTTASQIAEEVQRLRAGDDALPVDLTEYAQRRALVDALKWLEDRGVLVLRDGEVDRWLADDAGGDALYDLDQDIASRLLIASPSVLRDVEGVDDFLVEPLGASDDARTRALRHRIGRRVVNEPVVAFADLDTDELAHFRHRRTRIIRDLELLTGAGVEVRAEGVLLVDGGDLSATPFPGTGTEAQAALLWADGLVASAEAAGDGRPAPAGTPTTTPPSDHTDLGRTGSNDPTGPDPTGPAEAPITPAAPSPWRPVDREAADAAWQTVVDGYRTKFKTDYRDDPDKLRAAVEELLTRFGLVHADDDTIWCHAALARYRTEPDPAGDSGVETLDLWDGALA